MKKPASKVAEPAQIQPKFQFLFYKNLPPCDFSIMTLCTAQWGNKSHQTKSIFGLLRTSCAFVECIQTAGLDCEGFKKSSALVKFLASQGFN